MLACLGGNTEPTAADLKKILESVGAEVDDGGGTAAVAVVPTSGGGVVAPAAEAKKEEKVEKKEESDSVYVRIVNSTRKTVDPNFLPKAQRGLITIRRTCRKKIQDIISAVSAMIAALEALDRLPHSEVDTMKASEKLAEVLNEADIRLLVENLLIKKGIKLAEKEAKLKEKALVKELERSKRELEKEKKRTDLNSGRRNCIMPPVFASFHIIESDLYVSFLQLAEPLAHLQEKEQKRLQEEAEEERLREAENKKQIQRKDSNLDYDVQSDEEWEEEDHGEEFQALLQLQKRIHNITELVLQKNQPLITSNLMHEKTALLSAEDLSGISKFEQIFLQAFSLQPFLGGYPIEILNDYTEVEDQDVQKSQDSMPIKLNRRVTIAAIPPNGIHIVADGRAIYLKKNLLSC